MSIRATVMASGPLKGIFCLLISGAIFAFTDGLSKLLTLQYPPGEILFFRSAFVFLPIALVVWRTGGWASLRVVNGRGQLARGFFGLVTSFMVMVAIRHMPLADLTAVMFASPLVLTALAPYFLGEQVGWRRWTAVLVGFGGVLLMIRPHGEGLLWPPLLVLGATVLIAFRDILTRHLSRTDTTNAIMVCTTGFVGLGALSTIVLGWHMPDLEGFGMLALMGVLQGVGQYFLVSAFIHGEAVVVAPFRYFTLLWATLYGYLMFGDLPGMETLAGAAVVTASGLYIFYREARRSGRI
ncbi:MAG: DMT family transporter [Proteobacteria bacterium]|nr:DMT family transporter [Pseudomonadota bacterium]